MVQGNVERLDATASCAAVREGVRRKQFSIRLDFSFLSRHVARIFEQYSFLRTEIIFSFSFLTWCSLTNAHFYHVPFFLGSLSLCKRREVVNVEQHCQLCSRTVRCAAQLAGHFFAARGRTETGCADPNRLGAASLRESSRCSAVSGAGAGFRRPESRGNHRAIQAAHLQSQLDAHLHATKPEECIFLCPTDSMENGCLPAEVEHTAALPAFLEILHTIRPIALFSASLPLRFTLPFSA